MISPVPKKALGQHWLTDPATLEFIAEAGQLSSNDTVLEIGPGPGSLTEVLVKKVGQVVAVEYDQQLAADLPKNVPASNLTVIYHDILTFNLSQLPAGYKVIANIPYYLTSKLLRVLSEAKNPPSTIVLLIQKEVAERVAAKPGSLSLLGVSVQLYYQAHLGMVVPATLFSPPPKVDSQVVILHRYRQPLFGDVDYKLLMRVVKAGFSARRKTLLNSLSGGLRLEKPSVEAAIASCLLSPADRAQQLTLQNWHDLTLALTPLL